VTLLEFEEALLEEQEQPAEAKVPIGEEFPKKSYPSALTIALLLS
jgi:hypothetical protein